MANATFYSYSKRHNSTAVPTTGTVVDVQLKGGSDLIDPVFVIKNSGIPTWSMMSYEGRYYFITDIKSVREDLWEISCHVDVLATYKSNVQATSAYVRYHTHNNTELSDTRMGVNTTRTFDSALGTFSILGMATPSSCAVIVNVVGKHSCAAYALTQAEADSLLDDLDNWYITTAMPTPPPGGNPFQQVEEALTWFANSAFDAIKQLIATGKAGDSIRSAFMLPFTKANISGSSEPVVLGEYPTTITGTKITDRNIVDDTTVTIPWQATDWRRNAPYHEIYLYLPFVGIVSISPSDVMGATALYVRAQVDVLSGDAIFTVSAYGSYQYIAQYNTNIGAPYAIGSSNINPASAATAIVSGVATGLSAVASGGMSLALGTAGVMGLTNSLQAQPTCIGSNGGGAAMGLVERMNVICYTIFHDTVDSPSSMSVAVGTPTNKTMSLGSISGYVQTAAASVSGAMTDQEREEINNLLDGGVYIE